MNNFYVAKKQLENLKRNFENDEWVATKYKQIKRDRFDKGIMEHCVRDEKWILYMSHGAVVRTDKDTTKIHVTFVALKLKKKYP